MNFLPGRNNQGIVVRKDFHLFRYPLQCIPHKSRIIIELLQHLLRLIFPEVPSFASVDEEREYRKKHLVAAVRAFAVHGFVTAEKGLTRR